ncbi:enoyl-CoA hydratase [Photobacterium jeanii]|uniref:Enoyl-CoA hydratase n=1 Tax=Photobacterium jeanii TaxID=858640 RepID=A0A178K3Y2_9GAMM|nr:crotonase/enoyl-CoA hydratase family protein [Photobacterium jeanii]OAN11464.1 enoyl-CoA hydratase [Photobacterium jeanii]PST90984.1 crotonase/enoyl-CoA hydratase family protein [Photobacterium jeanii]
MEWTRLRVEENSGIVTVELHRPDKLNALDITMFEELDKISSALKKRRDIRAVILKGAGGNFSSGLDIKSMATAKSSMLKLLAKWLPGNANLAQRVSRNWRALPVPVIAVLEGRCFGGGLQIALGADFRYVTAETELSIMEVRWGLVPDMAGLLSLREVVGRDVAMQLTMTGEIISGEQAHALGLATAVVDDPMACAVAFCQKISQASPDAIAAIKHSTNKSWLGSERMLLARETLSQVRLLLGKNFFIAGKRQRKQLKGETASDIDYQQRQSFW